MLALILLASISTRGPQPSTAPEPAVAPEWTLLAPPRGTRASVAPVGEDVLLDAAHLGVDGPFRPAALEILDPPIPLATFQQMLDETLRLRGMKLETRPLSGTLLVRGDAGALVLARELVADLDRQVEAFEVDLEVVVRRADAAPTTWKRRVRGGTENFFGAREVRPFVAGFDVQVAQDAGQAEPRVGAALAGTGVHVRAMRLAGGTRVFVDGLLDTAEIVEVVDFDPETPDLGVLEQPRIESTQIAFSGVVESGRTLRVELANSPRGGPPLSLEVKATAQPDTANTGEGWALLDLGFVASSPRPLMPVDPGVGLSNGGQDSTAASAFLPPAALAAILESDRVSGDARASRSSVVWSGSLIAFLRSDAARIDTARALVRALEDARTQTVRAELASGPWKATFPITAARRGRCVTGLERPYLTDYGLEVAPQIWMPAPRVERAFDGLVADLALEDGRMSVDAWRTNTAEITIATRDAAQMGRLELPRRGRVAGSGRSAPGESALALFDVGEPLAVRALAP